MPTEFGKLLRKLRIDEDTTLKSMAKTLGISQAYLSAIELGKRAIPTKIVDKLIKEFQLTVEMQKTLKKSVVDSSTHLVANVENLSDRKKQLLFVLIQSFPNLDDSDLEGLEKILKSSIYYEG